MKGYFNGFGFMGWIESSRKYVLFSTEDEYLEYLEEK